MFRCPAAPASLTLQPPQHPARRARPDRWALHRTAGRHLPSPTEPEPEPEPCPGTCQALNPTPPALEIPLTLKPAHPLKPRA